MQTDQSNNLYIKLKKIQSLRIYGGKNRRNFRRWKYQRDISHFRMARGAVEAVVANIYNCRNEHKVLTVGRNPKCIKACNNGEGVILDSLDKMLRKLNASGNWLLQCNSHQGSIVLSILLVTQKKTAFDVEKCNGTVIQIGSQSSRKIGQDLAWVRWCKRTVNTVNRDWPNINLVQASMFSWANVLGRI